MIRFTNYFDNQTTKQQSQEIDNVFQNLVFQKNKNMVGYYTLADNSKKIHKQLKKYKKQSKLFSEKKIKDIIVLGVGGSSLGTKALYEILKYQKKLKIKLHFLENVDPIEIENSLAKLKKSSSLFIIISKSGGTIETISTFKYICERFNIDLQKDAKRLIIVTDEDSNLSKVALKNEVPQFNIPHNVGGRFSVMSAVGLVPLYLCGFDTKELLQGFGSFIDSFFQKEQNHLLEKAFFYSKNSKITPINTIFSYRSSMYFFNDWYVQLWGESLGKIDTQGKAVGLTPIGLVGSVDQHSFLQLIVEGPKDKTVSFIKIDDFESDLTIPYKNIEFLENTNFINGHKFNTLINEQASATLETLKERNISVDEIVLDRLDSFHLGSLIAYYELLTSAVGAFLKVNTYDQPGVEFGKQKLIKKFS